MLLYWYFNIVLYSIVRILLDNCIVYCTLLLFFVLYIAYCHKYCRYCTLNGADIYIIVLILSVLSIVFYNCWIIQGYCTMLLLYCILYNTLFCSLFLITLYVLLIYFYVFKGGENWQKKTQQHFWSWVKLGYVLGLSLCFAWQLLRFGH